MEQVNDITSDIKQCKYNTKCSAQGRCLNFNAKHNLQKTNDMFFKRLLFHRENRTNGGIALSTNLAFVQNQLDSNNITSLQLEMYLKKVLSGLT